MDADAGQVYRFGIFEVDPRSGELRRSGVRIKVQEQPFQVLLKLLQHPGDVVAREELRSALWPGDTFVDFDTGLNTAIKRLREVLGDSADNPRFIETVPRRGYRFVAPLNGAPRPASLEQGSTPKSTIRRGRWFPLTIGFGGAIVMAAVGALIAVALTPKPVPRITGFAPITSDGLAKGNLLTDGNRIYFEEISSDHFILTQSSVKGGGTALVDASFLGWALLDLSADGSELLVCRCKDTIHPQLWTIPVPAGPPRDLHVLSRDASWAPNGTLVFSSYNDLLVADHYGTNPRKLLSAPGAPAAPAFSPDGKRIRFNVYDEAKDTSAIWEARIDGSEAHPLLPGWGDPPQQCCGRWTPDGRYFVFVSFHEGESKIWALPETTPFWRGRSHGPILLTAGPMNFSSPLPSTDGKRLFVVASQPRAELVRFDSKSGQFLPFLGGISAGDVEFSPDGKSVLYVRYPEGTLWRSKADGSEPQQLTYPPLEATLAHWSPDGTKIVFSGAREGQHWTIYQIAAGGGTPELLSPGKTDELDATWSPDQSHLAFGQYQPSGSRLTTVIQLLDLKSRALRQVPGSDNLCCPRWSPDGRYIAGISIDQWRLMLYDVASQRWQVILDHVGDFGYLTWSRDSRYLYFDTLFARNPEFSRIRIGDRHVERIAELKNLRRYWGHWGPWTGIGPDEAPLIVRDISSQEIYALDWQLP